MSGMRIGRFTVDQRVLGQRWYARNPEQARSAIGVLEEVSSVRPVSVVDVNEGVLGPKSKTFGPRNMQGWNIQEDRAITWGDQGFSESKFDYWTQMNDWVVAFLSAVDSVQRGVEWLIASLEKATRHTVAVRVDNLSQSFGEKRMLGAVERDFAPMINVFPINLCEERDLLLRGEESIVKDLAWFLRDSSRNLDGGLDLYGGLVNNEEEARKLLRRGRTLIPMSFASRFLDRAQDEGIRLVGVYLGENSYNFFNGRWEDIEPECQWGDRFLEYGGHNRYLTEKTWSGPGAPYLLGGEPYTDQLLKMAGLREQNPWLDEGRLLRQGRFHSVSLHLDAEQETLTVSMRESDKPLSQEPIKLKLDWKKLINDKIVGAVFLTTEDEPKLK